MSLLKNIAKTVLPDAVVERIGHRRAVRSGMQERRGELDLSPLELLRNAPLSSLSDASFLEHDLLPKLGLNDELLHQFPPSLYPYTGRGLRYWQYPNQFSKYLVEISKLGIESYLEIGTRHGGTFVITVEYLSRFHPVQRAVGIDLGAPSKTLKAWARSRPGVTLLHGDSQGKEFRRFIREGDVFDLVLIDGDHSEKGCRRDYELVAEHSRALVFHDIVSEPTPGVRAVWSELRRTQSDRFDIVELTEQYDEVARVAGVDFIGIGLAIPRGWSRATSPSAP